MNIYIMSGKLYLNEKLEYEVEYLYNKNLTVKDKMKMVILYMN